MEINYYKSFTTVDELLGKTLVQIDGMANESDSVTFYCSDGSQYLMFHDQDCCEDVRIIDVCGDVNCLLNSPITMVEEVVNDIIEEQMSNYQGYLDDSHTWTWYKLATVKGYVTLRWLGESNGYYSESVDFRQVK